LKQVAGFWLPASERHLVPVLEASPRFFKGPTYQVDKLLACLPYIRRFGVAVDVGAHCGLWSRVLVKMFRQVHAVEPVALHVDCLRRNVPGVEVHQIALGIGVGRVRLATGVESSGDTRVDEGGPIETAQTTLDELGLPKVDFVKIDCEGYEYFVALGGQVTLQRDRPCVIVEQKAGMGERYKLARQSAVDLLKSWGAIERFEMSGDYCLSWD
jgi:FkbM family methyltransferase